MVQSDIKEQTSQAALSQLRGSAPGPMQENTSNLQNSHSMERQLLQNTDNSCNNVTTKTSSESTADLAPSTLSNISKSKGDNYVKLKPENFSGNDDFEDFRAQFEITSKINGWDYRAKSLYLTNCLTGANRSLLNELTAEHCRDYQSLVCVEVLRPSQPNGVMSSAVSLPNHTFTGKSLQHGIGLRTEMRYTELNKNLDWTEKGRQFVRLPKPKK